MIGSDLSCLDVVFSSSRKMKGRKAGRYAMRRRDERRRSLGERANELGLMLWGVLKFFNFKILN